jgi:hypothetical protein
MRSKSFGASVAIVQHHVDYINFIFEHKKGGENI